MWILPIHVQQRVKNARFSRDKMQLQSLDQQEGQFSQRDHTRDKIRHRVRQMLSDSPTEENRLLIIKGKREIWIFTFFSCSFFCLLLFIFSLLIYLTTLCLPQNMRWFFSVDLHLNGSTLTSTKADLLSDESPISPASPVSPPGLQSPIKCFTPPHQPSPPTVPPNPKNLSRVRRAPSLSRTRPSLSHSSG